MFRVIVNGWDGAQIAYGRRWPPTDEELDRFVRARIAENGGVKPVVRPVTPPGERGDREDSA